MLNICTSGVLAATSIQTSSVFWSVTNLIVLGLLSIGNAALWVTYVNWTHSFPQRCSTLQKLRIVHDFFVVLVPVVLVFWLGIAGPGLLFGGSWENLNPWMWGLVGFCSIGLAKLLVQTIRYQLRQSPSTMVVTESRVEEISNRTNSSLVSSGKYQRLARLPGNEQLRVEFNEKTFHLGGLPEELEELTILHISDWHFLGTITKEFFVEVCEIISNDSVDLVCFTGDLIDSQPLTDWIPDTLGKLTGRLGNYFILGNHDWYQEPASIRKAITDLNWVDVSSRTVMLDVDGSRLEIGGDETPWMGEEPKFSTAADFKLLLAHTPDRFSSAKQQRVNLVLSGHNHGGQVQLPIIGPLYSPSRHDTKYASGLFDEPPSMMHVSRGLAGRHPLRIRCLPEVTRITLHGERHSS
ncbi:metallophosphoesterase [Thalassoglobus sp. JC818]|uniref:metallophosphoesterase n=1 Tax=Thalassoglobus sp. JC818 TaxID=3232136 RepID=UPI00345B36F8